MFMYMLCKLYNCVCSRCVTLNLDEHWQWPIANKMKKIYLKVIMEEEGLLRATM